MGSKWAAWVVVAVLSMPPTLSQVLIDLDAAAVPTSSDSLKEDLSQTPQSEQDVDGGILQGSPHLSSRLGVPRVSLEATQVVGGTQLGPSPEVEYNGVPGKHAANPPVMLEASQVTHRVPEEDSSGSIDDDADALYPRVLRPSVSALQMMVKMAEQKNKAGASQDHDSHQTGHSVPDLDPLQDHIGHQTTDNTQDRPSDHTQDQSPEEESTQRIDTLSYFDEDYQQEDVSYGPESLGDTGETPDSSYGLPSESPVPHVLTTKSLRTRHSLQDAQQPGHPNSFRYLTAQQFLRHTHSQQYPQRVTMQQYMQHAPTQQHPPQHALPQQRYPQHASSQPYPQHAPMQQQQQQQYPKHTTSQQSPQQASWQRYPQLTSSQQRYPQPTFAHQHQATQQYWQEAKRQLAERLEQHLHRLTQDPQAQQIVQQLLEQNPQAQAIMEDMLERQVSQSDLVHSLHLQGITPKAPPMLQAAPEAHNSSEVDTFNIVITKNLTGGQSKPSVQFLSDAKVDSMLLNTSIASVTDIRALKRVVESAVGQAVASRPVAIQEAIAQVVESPGREPTVNVVNSTIPSMKELEVTINDLLGSQVVYDDQENHTGHIPHSDGSVVNRLLNNTIGVENLNINSTSKTNVVNIFIINIIGGVGGDEGDGDPYPVHVSSVGPIISPPASGEPPLDSKNPVKIDFSDVDSEILSSLISGGQSSVEEPLLPLKPPSVVPSLISPGNPSSGSIPSPFAHRPASLGPPALPPSQASQSSFESKGPPPPSLATLPPTEVTHLAGFTTSPHPANPDGIILNNNQVLNLLPQFIRATTIPPVVPLYNTSVHEILGKKPSVLGLLPNKVFDIIKPQVEPSSNYSYGGIIRKTMLGNLTRYFPTGTPPVLTRVSEDSKTDAATPPNVQYRYPPYTPVIPPTDPVPSNPFPFHKESLPQDFSLESPVYQRFILPDGSIAPSFPPSPALGTARSQDRKKVPFQSPMQQFNVVNEHQPQRQSDVNLLKFTGSGADEEGASSAAVSSLGMRTGQAEGQKPQEPAGHESTSKQNGAGKKKNKKEKKTSGIRELAADVMAGAESRMDNFMKAVAIGALPSSVAFATALWPYWAPFVLGKRRKRSLTDDVVKAAPRGDLTHDWLSILTGMKYKDAGNEFPSAWDRRKSSPKREESSPEHTSAHNGAGAERQTSGGMPDRQGSPVETKATSTSSMTTQGAEKDSAYGRINDPSREAAALTKSDTLEASDSTISEEYDNLKPGEVTRTTEKATTVRRSTDKLDDSIAQMMTSLVTDNDVIFPGLGDDSGTTTEENKDKDSPADVALVTNFLYSALNGWKDGESPDETLAAAKEDLPPAVTGGFIDLELNTDFPGQKLNVTDSPIYFINAAPAVQITTGSQASQPTTILADAGTSTNSISSRFPSRRRSTTTSKPTMFVANQALVTHTEEATDPGLSLGDADDIADTTLTLQARPGMVSGQTTASTPPAKTIPADGSSVATVETTSLPPLTSTPNRRTAKPPSTTTTTTTTATTTTTPTTTTTTTTPTTTTTTTTSTTTTTTPTTTAPTTTTVPPGIFESISSVIGTSNDQLQNAIGFVGSVAVYGAAALMPLWLPIVLGKRRRRRSTQEEDLRGVLNAQEEDLQEILNAVRMTYSPPLVKRSSQEDSQSSGEIRKKSKFLALEEGSNLFSHNLKARTRYTRGLQNRKET